MLACRVPELRVIIVMKYKQGKYQRINMIWGRIIEHVNQILRSEIIYVFISFTYV